MRSIYFILVALAVLTAACSDRQARLADSLDYATAQLAENPAEARKTADAILEKARPGELSASQLGRLSLLYMQLSDRDDSDDMTALAFQCYRNAFKADADSAALFFASVEEDNARYAIILSQLMNIMEHPDSLDILTDHDIDPTE